MGNFAVDASAGQIMVNATDSPRIVDLVIVPTGDGDDLIVTTEEAGVFRRVGGTWSASNTGIRATNVRAVAAHPHVSGTVFAGSSDGASPSQGVFRSVDAGAQWSVPSTGLRAKSVRSLMIDPTAAASPTSTVIYAGGQGVFESNAYVNAGLWKSSDGGMSWSDINAGIPSTSPSAPLGTVRAIALDVRSCVNPPPAPMPCSIGPLSTVYATSTGAFGVGSFRIIKSVDAGALWSDIDGLPPRMTSNGGLQFVTPLPIVIDPHDSAHLYVGSYASLSGAEVGIANGVFRSTDGGDNWGLYSSGLPLRSGSTQTHFDVYALAIDAQIAGTLWASAIETGAAGAVSRIFKTIDGGAQWLPSSDGITGGDIRQLVVDPTTPGTLYAAALGDTAAPGGVYRSRDGATTWHSISIGLDGAGASALAVDTLEPSRLYAGTSAGVFVLEQPEDGDSDGIPDTVETAGPNGGDGNADGIADALQPQVATFSAKSSDGHWQPEGGPSTTGSADYITVEIEATNPGSCAQLVDTQAVAVDDRPSDGVASTRFEHVLPLVRFEVLDCPGAAALVTFHGSPQGSDARFRFHGPSQPGSDDLRWRNFDDRATRVDAQSWRLRLDAGAFGSYRPATAGSILFEGGVGSDRVFANGFD